ncbi:MAG TPA: DUF4173 domain-containing protein [Chitinophagales bacterium]|nr:DUF4173 domain-containing protein [Chitinophagales bacterium]
MKRNHYFIVVAGGVYSYLFYQQSSGLNFFVFSLLLVVLAWVSNRQAAQSPLWLSVAAGTLLTGFATFLWGDNLAVFANLVSLLLLAAITHSPYASLVVALLQTCTSFVMAVPDMLGNKQPADNADSPGISPAVKKAILTFLPMVVVLVFFVLYRSSNPLFANVTDNIDLSFISPAWFICTATGLYLMYVFFTPQTIAYLTKADQDNSDTLSYIGNNERDKTVIAQVMSYTSEVYTCVLLLAMLNMLVFAVNGIDAYYLFIIRKLPDDMTWSEYLHDGTNGLIVSIMLAVVIILFYFNGHLNFSADNRKLRRLAGLWVVQNIFLVVTTTQRNWFYISEYGLTHKRIGVMVFLWLCVAGLVLTLIKVVQVKNNWFLFRKNAWVLYLTIVACSLVNRDSIIASHNIALARRTDKPLDEYYLNHLSANSLVTLFEEYRNEKSLPAAKRIFSSSLVAQMKVRYYAYLENRKAWQSYNYTTYQIKTSIPQLIRDDKYLNRPE